MNDDLISRKALIEKLEEWCGNQTYLISEEVWKIIKNSPKAFDKEKVIKAIEYDREMSKKYSTGLREEGHIEAFNEAISIKIQIEIPDDRWFRGEWDFRPQDTQLCVVIPNIGNKNPLICQWRWENHNHVGMDAFCDISERFYHESIGIIEEEFIPNYLGMGNVDRWKPLGLPADVNEMVLAEIEKWFEEYE